MTPQKKSVLLGCSSIKKSDGIFSLLHCCSWFPEETWIIFNWGTREDQIMPSLQYLHNFV